jgi:hypothetical protein
MEIKKYTNADLLRFTKNLIEKQTSSTTNLKSDSVKVDFPYSQEQAFLQ